MDVNDKNDELFKVLLELTARMSEQGVICNVI